MVPVTIAVQPNLHAVVNLPISAYRQILFRVIADSIATADQPMYCDIYFDGTYYKTISSYTIYDDGSGHSVFTFDIQDAAQEYLNAYLPSIPNLFLTQTDAVTTYSITSTQVKFRGSSFTGTILVPQPTIPVQATATTPAVPGTGLACNTIIVVNTSLPVTWETIYDNAAFSGNSSLEDYLISLRVIGLSAAVGTRVYPMSNQLKNVYTNPNLGYCNRQWVGWNGVIPVLILQFGIAIGVPNRTLRNCSTWLIWGTNGVMSNFIAMATTTPISAGHPYYLQVGLNDIKGSISSSAYNVLIGTQDAYYRTAIHDDDANDYCFYSPLYKVSVSDNVETSSVWFQNSYGHFENFIFLRGSEDYNIKSSEVFRPYTQVFTSGSVSGGVSADFPSSLTVGKKRYNVRSYSEVSLTATVQESLMQWLKELFASPYILIQDKSNPTLNFRGAEVVDGTFSLKKTMTKAGVKYTITVKMRISIDPISLRN